MPRYIPLTALFLGAIALGSTACSRADDGDRPAVLDALEAKGLNIVEEFPADDGLRAFAAVAGQQHPVAVYVTASGSAIVGTRVDRDGNESDAGRLQELVAGPMSDKIWSQLDKAEWIQDGKPDAPHVVYLFSDPNCPFCNQLWHAARPWVDSGKVQLRHIMVGVIKEDSANKVATILAADDPSAALRQNESNYKSGGVQPAATVPAKIRETLDANQMLMMELGFGGTPGIVFRDADGTVERRNGLPRGDDLNVVMGGPH
ncbi:thiol:disulfide interchange protein DsbG [Luteimonas mephitis]|uniref:thiol:disulfide interchange protein DsbG n=1 Tax=Luteimonas mephitis TaxID=83615 RepID=UPI0004240B0D|nr:thiol:disulfide interchange protein DsbG [Luteimonas mephitis]